MAEDDHGFDRTFAASFQPGANQSGTNAPTLQMRPHRHGRQRSARCHNSTPFLSCFISLSSV